MTTAGTADVRALRSAAFDALAVSPDQLVIDLERFRWSRELRQAVLDIREDARRRHPDVLLVVHGRDTGPAPPTDDPQHPSGPVPGG